MGFKALDNIKVPIPDFDKVLRFDELLTKINEMRKLRLETAAELDALLPSILDKAFKGEF